MAPQHSSYLNLIETNRAQILPMEKVNLNILKSEITIGVDNTRYFKVPVFVDDTYSNIMQRINKVYVELRLNCLTLESTPSVMDNLNMMQEQLFNNLKCMHHTIFVLSDAEKALCYPALFTDDKLVSAKLFDPKLSYFVYRPLQLNRTINKYAYDGVKEFFLCERDKVLRDKTWVDVARVAINITSNKASCFANKDHKLFKTNDKLLTEYYTSNQFWYKQGAHGEEHGTICCLSGFQQKIHIIYTKDKNTDVFKDGIGIYREVESSVKLSQREMALIRVEDKVAEIIPKYLTNEAHPVMLWEWVREKLPEKRLIFIAIPFCEKELIEKVEKIYLNSVWVECIHLLKLSNV